MTERPILFSAPMVRALLAGTKTQTRRIVKLPAELTHYMGSSPDYGCIAHHFSNGLDFRAEGFKAKALNCPYGQPGDRLWVREAWARTRAAGAEFVVYREGDNRTDYGGPWKPSIHMPRAASRINLEITGVRVERLQAISEADAIAEGCTQNHNGYFWGGPHAAGGLKQMATAVQAYRDLWESINGPGSWDANPWVWCVEFRQVTP